jgi:hypothetical protein
VAKSKGDTPEVRRLKLELIVASRTIASLTRSAVVASDIVANVQAELETYETDDTTDAEEELARWSAPATGGKGGGRR